MAMLRIVEPEIDTGLGVVPGYEMAVKFSHNERGTVCVLLVGEIGSKDEDKIEYGRGESYIHPDDQLNKVIGRRLSVVRATDILDRKTRKKVLQEYAKKVNYKGMRI